MLLAAQMLKEVRGYIEEGVSPQIIMKGFRQACQLVSVRFGGVGTKLNVCPLRRPWTG